MFRNVQLTHGKIRDKHGTNQRKSNCIQMLGDAMKKSSQKNPPTDANKMQVRFMIKKGDEFLIDELVTNGDPPRKTEIEGREVTWGIYEEVIPTELGTLNKWQVIYLPKVNDLTPSQNRDLVLWRGEEPEEISEHDTPEERLRKFKENQKRAAQEITARIEVIPEELDVRPLHPDGKVCSECQFFDARRGREELEESTHVYENGSFAMLKEIVKITVDLHDAQNLTVKNVGHCPKIRGLVAKTTPACEAFAPPEKVKK